MKPLDMSEFSGGLTDNFFDGGASQYYQADNWWITVDKNLQVRSGTTVIDPVAYQLPVNIRVSAMFTFIQESLLLAQAARTFYSYTPGQPWAPILGPNGINETLGAGDQYSNVVACEWNRHLYVASDAQPIPSKIYRDINNNYAVRTVGLPRAFSNPNLTNDQVLAKSLNLANAICQSMQSHINDLNLHSVLDKVALNYFVAQTFNPGDELPPVGVVPVASCNDLPSLLKMIGALNSAYEHQRADASNNGVRVYHLNIIDQTSGTGSPIKPTGMHVKLSNQATPTIQTVPANNPTASAVTLTLAIAAPQVDDLAQKWYWHRFAVWTHSSVNDYGTLNQHTVAVPKVGTILANVPTATANLVDYFNYANNLKFTYNTHLKDGGISGAAHKFADNNFPTANGATPPITPLTVPNEPFTVGLADAVDYDSAANLIFWMRCLYSLHYNDAALATYRTVGCDVQSANNTLANVNYLNPFTSLITLPFSYLYAGGSIFVNGVPATLAFASSAGASFTYVNSSVTQNQVIMQTSSSAYHVALDASGNVTDAFPMAVGGSFAPNVNSALSSQVDSVAADAPSWLALASELFSVLGAHISDGTVHNAIKNVAGILSIAPYQPFFIPSIAQYVWAFIFTDTYQVEPNGIIYTVQSNPVFTAPIQTGTIIPPGATVVSEAPALYPNVLYTTIEGVNLSNLPTLLNTANTNYDLANITLDIYRSTDGGTTFFLDDSIANGTTSYQDVTADSVSYTNFPALNTNQPLYTTGGVVGNDQPPQAGCIATLGGYTYYGNIIDTGQAFPNRVRQSLQNSPDSAPATFFDDLEDNVIGLAPTRALMVAFCGRSVYRLQGNFNSLGQGLIVHERISQNMGCVSAKSIVQTEIGLFFAGLDGFYYTDGYQLIKITTDLNTRYQAYTQSLLQQKRIVGTYDRYNRRINWAMQSTPTDSNPDTIWWFYLDYGVKPQGVFTTASNFTYFRPASVIAYLGNIIYGHELGYFLKFDSSKKTDPIIQTGVNPTLWNEAYLPYNFASCALNFGSVFQRKWTTKVHWVGQNQGNVSAQVTSIRDNRLDIAALLAPVQLNYNPMWGQPNIFWQPGDSVNPYPWEYDHKIDAWRRFPAGNLRCDIKQITITPAFAGVYRSEDWPNFCFAAISGSGTSKTVTIATPAGYTNIVWPIDCVNYVIAFSTDGYEGQYLITNVSTNTLTIADPNNSLTSIGTLNWVIRGYKKQQRPRIDSLIIYYDFLGDKNDQYLGRQSSGENI